MLVSELCISLTYPDAVRAVTVSDIRLLPHKPDMEAEDALNILKYAPVGAVGLLSVAWGTQRFLQATSAGGRLNNLFAERYALGGLIVTFVGWTLLSTAVVGLYTGVTADKEEDD